MSAERNRHGVFPAQHIAEVCQSCGTCYYFCPELGAIRVHRRKSPERSAWYEPAA